MGDLLGSLIQGSQKRTILCIIGVGCYKYYLIDLGYPTCTIQRGAILPTKLSLQNPIEFEKISRIYYVTC
jgi:hypothetical protein